MAQAIIIGAGIAGIAVAVRLALKGWEVTVLEANAYPGGKLSEVAMEGFRFDAGPIDPAVHARSSAHLIPAVS
jgi:phytoene desaturase